MMAEVPDKYREEAKEVALAAHGAARDDKDHRSDVLTARLLDMVVGLQRDVMDNIHKEGKAVQELKEGLARVERRVEEFVSAFPEGDAIRHRLEHEAREKKAKKKELFWDKIKFTLVAILLSGAVVWVGVVVWRAFLIGPKG
jgi:hypothetical protein